jgi:uncharacterized peroxidase-related enzyme
MAFISTPEPAGEYLAENRSDSGYVPNVVTTFSARPAVFEAWKQLNGAIKANMDLRRYELATVAAATALKSSYCSLAHGGVLAENFFTDAEVAALVDKPASDPVDEAVMTFARKVALAADTVTAADVDHLRALGLSDEDVLDVTLAAAARAFFSKTLDATGTLPDAIYHNLSPQLKEALTVGRPIDS